MGTSPVSVSCDRSTAVMDSSLKFLPTVSFLERPEISKALLSHSVTLQSAFSPNVGASAVSVSRDRSTAMMDSSSKCLLTRPFLEYPGNSKALLFHFVTLLAVGLHAEDGHIRGLRRLRQVPRDARRLVEGLLEPGEILAHVYGPTDPALHVALPGPPGRGVTRGHFRPGGRGAGSLLIRGPAARRRRTA